MIKPLPHKNDWRIQRVVRDAATGVDDGIILVNTELLSEQLKQVSSFPRINPAVVKEICEELEIDWPGNWQSAYYTRIKQEQRKEDERMKKLRAIQLHMNRIEGQLITLELRKLFNSLHEEGIKNLLVKKVLEPFEAKFMKKEREGKE